MIRFRRAGGLRLPQFDELLEIEEDGSFSMWRSVSTASALPSPIGRFAGQLPEEARGELIAATGDAVADGPRTGTIAPDSPIDRIRVDGTEATLGIHDPAEGAWRSVAALLRPLLKTLTEFPVAAVALEVGGGGARLVHQGPEELPVDLSKLDVEVIQWRGDDSVARWKAPSSADSPRSVGTHGTYELPFDHGFDLQDGDRITARATFKAQRRDRWVSVSLQTP